MAATAAYRSTGMALPHLDGAIERARQRRILDDGHAGPARLRLDLFGEQVASLGQHLGRLHGGEVEAQRHGIVGGIGEHDGGLAPHRPSPAAAHLALQAANAAANLRAAFGLLELVAQILLAHLQARFAALPFDQVIDRRPAEEQPRRSQQQVRRHRSPACSRRAVEKGGMRQLPANPLHRKDGQQRRRQQRLAKPRRGAQRKQILDV